MAGESLWQAFAFGASVTMPLFNIPLLVRMIKRRSSDDLSLVWLYGVFSCIVLMLPYGLMAQDKVLRAFSISNFFLFGLVVLVATRLRLKAK